MNPTNTIRALNDELRRSRLGCIVTISAALQELDEDFVGQALEAVRTFDAFTEANDPHGEHDCAVVAVADKRVMFKIDYYDRNLLFGSPDPADPEVTSRVLTIMLPSDY